MYIEYEATFKNIDKDEIRSRLKKAGATLVRSEYLQKRVPFYLPTEKRSKDSWLRVRDEGDKTTLSLKIVSGERIDDQKEICLVVDDYDGAVELLESIGCERKAYQETKRELWELDGVEIAIDEWPFLEPFVEVEGKSEDEVKRVSDKIGFNYDDALFCAVWYLYKLKYNVEANEVNGLDKLVFDMENPFIKK